MSDEVMRYLDKAEHALIVAEDLMGQGHAPDAAFGYQFAKPGRIDARFHKMLMNARKIREIADYDIDEEIVEPVANLKIEEGRAFLAEIKRFLGVIA